MSQWRAEWSGGFPNLCSGEWTLYKDGNPIDNIPFQGQPAGTYGEYQTWSFDENWNEYFYTYTGGADEKAWIQAHRAWLETIADESDFSKIYRAFSVSDWRYESCGGCI